MRQLFWFYFYLLQNTFTCGASSAGLHGSMKEIWLWKKTKHTRGGNGCKFQIQKKTRVTIAEVSHLNLPPPTTEVHWTHTCAL